MITLGDIEASKLYVGGEEVTKAYYGTKMVWPAGYITDGLIFQLDGINKGDEEGYWTDLIGGIKFSLATATPTDNGVQFSASSDVRSAATSTTFPIATSHLEIVLDNWRADNNSKLVFIKQANNQIACGFYQKNIIAVSQGTSLAAFVNPITTDNIPVQFSYNKNNGYCNGVATTRGTSTYWNHSGDNKICLGRRGSGNNYTRKIYAVRVYNRFLTEEEVIYNYNIDKARYNL